MRCSSLTNEQKWNPLLQKKHRRANKPGKSEAGNWPDLYDKYVCEQRFSKMRSRGRTFGLNTYGVYTNDRDWIYYLHLIKQAALNPLNPKMSPRVTYFGQSCTNISFGSQVESFEAIAASNYFFATVTCERRRTGLTCKNLSPHRSVMAVDYLLNMIAVKLCFRFNSKGIPAILSEVLLDSHRSPI